MTTTTTKRSTTTFHIVGDAFVDLLCFLNDSNSLPEAGGDSRLDQPVKAYAGGSGLNTTTHLQALSKRHNTINTGVGDGGDTATSNDSSPVAENYASSPSSSLHEVREILLHTCLNPNDQYGQLLEKHAELHGFPLLNCHHHHHHHRPCIKSHPTNGGTKKNSMHNNNGINKRNHVTNGNSSSSSDESSSSSSTGHCIIIVAGGERSFMTHVGCLEHFKASDLDMNRILDHHDADQKDDGGGGGGAIHVHIAGYFNLAGFHDGNLTALLESIREARQQQQQQHPTVFSLVAQHDATQQWDGGLEHVIPLLDFLILNELEASHIVQSGRQRQRRKAQQGAGPKLEDNNSVMNGLSAASVAPTSISHGVDTTTPSAAASVLLDPEEWISYFGSNHGNDDCIVVVTRGAQGAMAFGQNRVIAMVEPAVPVSVIVDPTGAGDAFAAGFLHGIWEHYWQNEQELHQQDALGRKDVQRVTWSADAIHHGLMWGCAAGTATVRIRGASIPPQYEDIEFIYKQQQEQQRERQSVR